MEVTTDNQAYCGDHFIVDTNIKSVCCISENNIMAYVNYTSGEKN